MTDLPYPRESLHRMGPQRSYGREATQAAFLLGGIGTGNVSIGSRGDLRDWEIFNRSVKGQKLPYSFFSIAVRRPDGETVAHVLKSRLVPPFADSHEVWTGIEYQVAAHLIIEGHVDEGLAVVKAVRDRHDGVRRGPWNEVECGHHYARSMASWGLLLALSGFSFDMVEDEMVFDPVVNADDFRCFWSTGAAWGTYRQRRNPETESIAWDVDVLHGSLEGVKVKVEGP